MYIAGEILCALKHFFLLCVLLYCTAEWFLPVILLYVFYFGVYEDFISISLHVMQMDIIIAFSIMSAFPFGTGWHILFMYILFLLIGKHIFISVFCYQLFLHHTVIHTFQFCIT